MYLYFAQKYFLGLDRPPSSWSVFVEDRQVRALVAKDQELFLLDHGGQYTEQVKHKVMFSCFTMVYNVLP